MFQRFLGALDEGHIDELQDLLAADVVSCSDGGGKVRAARYPIAGADHVVRFFGALRRHLSITEVQTLEVNGRTAALLRFGRHYQLLAVDSRAGKIQEIYSIINPDKLDYLRHQLADRP